MPFFNSMVNHFLCTASTCELVHESHASFCEYFVLEVVFRHLVCLPPDVLD